MAYLELVDKPHEKEIKVNVFSAFPFLEAVLYFFNPDMSDEDMEKIKKIIFDGQTAPPHHAIEVQGFPHSEDDKFRIINAGGGGPDVRIFHNDHLSIKPGPQCTSEK